MIRVYLPSQAAGKTHNQEIKPTNLSAPSEFLCLSCFIIIQSCYFNYRRKKRSHLTFATWSAFRALFTRSRCTTCAKDHGLFMLLPTNQWGRKTQSHVFLKTHRKCNAYCVSRGTDTYPTCCVNATKNVAFLGAFGTSSIIMKYFHNLIGCKPPCFALTTKRGPAGEAATWGPYSSSHLLASYVAPLL